MTFGTASPWKNEALCARVAELWKDHSATQICAIIWEEMRIELGRNMVVGWLHRKKITVEQKLHVHPQTRGERPKPKPRLRITPANTNSNGLRIILTHEPAELKALRCAAVIPLLVALVDLEPGHCRYPYDGEGPTTYCGHEKAEGFSYCQPHANLSIAMPIRPKAKAMVIA